MSKNVVPFNPQANDSRTIYKVVRVAIAQGPIALLDIQVALGQGERVNLPAIETWIYKNCDLSELDYDLGATDEPRVLYAREATVDEDCEEIDGVDFTIKQDRRGRISN